MTEGWDIETQAVWYGAQGWNMGIHGWDMGTQGVEHGNTWVGHGNSWVGHGNIESGAWQYLFKMHFS